MVFQFRFSMQTVLCMFKIILRLLFFTYSVNLCYVAITKGITFQFFTNNEGYGTRFFKYCSIVYVVAFLVAMGMNYLC
jgi:hypothetical protein